MILGYLHIGSPEHGICRYGRLLAGEAQHHSDLSVIEVSVTLTHDHQRNTQELTQAAHCLAEADLVHIQFSTTNNKYLWGQGWAQLSHLKLFRKLCQQPLVVTLHDVYDVPPDPHNHFSYLAHFLSHLSPLPHQGKSSAPHRSAQEKRLSFGLAIKKLQRYRWRTQKKFRRIPDDISIHWLLNEVQQVLVASSEEAKRLSQSAAAPKIEVIPHFVEMRSQTITKLDAQKTLNLNGYKVITLLGFIHGRKGHQLMVSAISKLPQNVKVIFAGGASTGQETFLEQLLSLAESEGVSDRLRITGYLSESNLELYLIATDLAICPFESFSASGSLSTWISVTCPILAYELPQIAEYNQLSSNSIKTFQPYTADALAKATINHLSADNVQHKRRAVELLREKLLLPEVFNKHLACYKQLIMTPCSAS